MAMNSDLKHVLENIFYGDSIILDSPVEFYITGDTLKHKIVSLYKKGRSWKMVDEFSNEWTISNIPNMFQHTLYYATLSMRDPRVNPLKRTIDFLFLDSDEIKK